MEQIKKYLIIIGIAILVTPSISNAFPFFGSEKDSITVVYFMQYGCPDCYRMQQYLENNIIGEYKVNIKKYNTRQDQENIELFKKFSEKYDTPLTVPLLFIGDNYVTKRNVDSLSIYIEQAIESNVPSPLERVERKNESNMDEITLPAVIGAAAVDAVNPCAFAVLILLLGTIMLASKNKKKIFGVGIAFTVAVFISYTLMGLGLYKAIQISGIRQYIYLGVAILAIILGLVNMRDYVLGDKFNIEVPESWKPKLESITSSITSIPGAFGSGFLVSLFLLPCTSGPYIVIVGMLGNQATRLQALLLLILYNLIFIVPFIVITTGVAFGFTTTARVEQWRKSKLGKLHLITGIVMVLLGIAMMFYFFINY